MCENEVSRVEKTVDALDHAWDEGKVTADPTCTDPGVKTFTCTREGCGETKTEAVATTGHTADWSAPTVSEKPTCVADGSAAFKCTNCEATFTLNPSDEATKPTFMSDEDWAAFVAAYEATGHDLSRQEEVWENVKLEQTDEKTGQIVDQVDRVTYKYCTNEGCDHREEVSRVTENHQLYVSNELTIREGNGDVRKVSTLSEEELTTYELKEGGKNFGKIKDGYVNVSCTETAYLFYLCPDECAVKPDNPIKVELEAFAPEHNFVAGAYVEGEEPNCTEGGKQIYTCAYCGEQKTENVGPLGHKEPASGVTQKDPTCEENGTRSYVCEVCKQTITETYDPETGANKDLKALGHDPQVTGTKVVYVDNNMHNVITTYTCTRCGDTKTEGEELVFKTEEEAEAAKVKYGYSFDIYQDTKDGMFYFTDASCDDNGVRIYLCECGYWWEDTNFATKYVDKLGHEYGEAVKVEGDCVTGGYSIFVCERCGDSYAVTYDQADGHVWKIVAADPSDCTTNGNYAYAYCSVCGAVLKLEDQTLTEADEATLDKFEVDYVEGLNYLTDKEAVEEYFFDEADGHKFDKVINLAVKGCTDPMWQVTVCSACLESKEGYVFIAKADPEDFTQNEETYVATDLSAMAGLTDEQKAEYIKDIVRRLNFLDNGSFTVEDIVDGEVIKGWNFTGLTFIAAKGHTLNKYQSVDNEGKLAEGTVAAAVCVADANIVSYAKALEYAQIVYPDVDETAFKAAFDAIFKTDDSTRDTYEINTDGKPALAGFCTQCGLPIAVAEHDVVYNMYVVTNGVNGAAYVPGETINYNTAHVSETLFYVVDKDGILRVDENGTPIGMTNEQIAEQSDYTKAVYTEEQIIAFGYYNKDDNGEFLAVNCYFYSFCANCGNPDGIDRDHSRPTPDQWDKYRAACKPAIARGAIS